MLAFLCACTGWHSFSRPRHRVGHVPAVPPGCTRPRAATSSSAAADTAFAGGAARRTRSVPARPPFTASGTTCPTEETSPLCVAPRPCPSLPRTKAAAAAACGLSRWAMRRSRNLNSRRGSRLHNHVCMYVCRYLWINQRRPCDVYHGQSIIWTTSPCWNQLNKNNNTSWILKTKRFWLHAFDANQTNCIFS